MKPSDAGLFLKATLQIYLDAARSAAQGLIRNWIIIFASVLSAIIFQLALQLIPPAGFASGMVLGLIQLILLTFYYSWIADTVQKEKLSFKNLYNFDYSLFSSIISVAFIFFIIRFLIGTLILGRNLEWVEACVQLGIVIIFNAAPEVIIVQRTESFDALSRAATFVRNNWIEWFLPFILVITPLLRQGSPAAVLVQLANAEPLLPPYFVFESSVWLIPQHPYLGLLLAVIIANWFMLFRVHVFKELESGNRRRRMYIAKQR